MAFKMKHLGGSPLNAHSPGHGAWTEWQNSGEARITKRRGEQGGKKGIITTIEQDQKRTAKDQMSNEDWKKYILNESPKRKEERLRRQNQTLTKTFFRPEQQRAVKLDPVGIDIKTKPISADVNIKVKPVKSSGGDTSSKTDTPKRKKIRRNPPGRVIREGVRDVGEGIGAIGSAIGRGAENVVNNLFGARSIFRICKKCK